MKLLANLKPKSRHKKNRKVHEFYSTKGMPVFLYILSPVISYNCRTYNGNYFVWPFGDLHASAA